MKYSLPKIIIIFVLIIIGTIIPACDRQEYVPYVYVNIQVYPNMPSYSSIKIPGNYLYLNGGYKGIVLSCTYLDEYVAFDRACPYHPRTEDAVLEVDSTGLFLVCPKCGSKFMCSDGSIVNGPSKHTPLEYLVDYQDPVLYIYNSYY